MVNQAGGWNEAIAALAQSTSRPGIIAWTNNLDYMYPTGGQNLIWAVVYGIVWAIVVMVSPWQTSRYLMAKNEHTVMRSSIWASMGVATVTIALYFTAAFIYKINPDLSDSSRAMIWAAMNAMPTVVGVILLTGILSAGISSASTFLSLVGASLTNDIFSRKDGRTEKKELAISRAGMAIVSVIVLVIAFLNPPQIFWIMYFGGTVIASAWGIVALCSVWHKKMSESAAFLGMLLGFAGCAVTKTVSSVAGITLPMYFDPFFVGLVLSAVGIIIGNRIKSATAQDMAEYDAMHTEPEGEKNVTEQKKTHRLTYVYIAFGLVVGVFFVLCYAVPYINAIR